MKKREKLFLATMPHAIHLFFKCCEKLAEANWQLTLPEDELAVEPRKRDSIRKNGKIGLFQNPRGIKWLDAPPFQTAYHDGRRYYIIFPRDEFWERPEINPFKAERDAWLAQRKEQARQSGLAEKTEATLATPPAPQPPVKPTITFKVTPRTETPKDCLNPRP